MTNICERLQRISLGVFESFPVPTKSEKCLGIYITLGPPVAHDWWL